MPFIRQQVGGTTAQINKYKGYDKQLVVNTGDHRLHIMDGETSGGYGVVMQYDLPLGSDDIADGAITSEKLADGVITANMIPDNAITSEKIKDGEVKTADLANGAVTADKIANGEVGEDELASGAVTEGKLATGAVTENKLADGAVTGAKLAPNSVTTSHIVDHTILLEDLNPGLIATPEEATAGTAANKLVTPAGLAAAIAAATTSNVTLSSVSVTWAANATSCTVSNSAIKAGSLLLINPPNTKTKLEALAEAEMYLVSQNNETAVLGALGTAPTIDISFIISVLTVE